jgi:hypothetical protein
MEKIQNPNKSPKSPKSALASAEGCNSDFWLLGCFVVEQHDVAIVVEQQDVAFVVEQQDVAICLGHTADLKDRIILCRSPEISLEPLKTVPPPAAAYEDWRPGSFTAGRPVPREYRLMRAGGILWIAVESNILAPCQYTGPMSINIYLLFSIFLDLMCKEAS